MGEDGGLERSKALALLKMGGKKPKHMGQHVKSINSKWWVHGCLLYWIHYFLCLQYFTIKSKILSFKE